MTVKFNSDVVFVDGSGQVVAKNGDLTLRGRDVIVGSGGSLRPELSSVVDLGEDALPWRHLFADGASFATRPTVGGSGVLLQGEASSAIASYTFNGFAPTTGSFTPVPWDQTIAENPIYSRSGPTIMVLEDGVYEVDFTINLARTPFAGSALVESRLTVNGGFGSVHRGFSTFYSDVTLPIQAVQVSKQLAVPLSSGDVLQVGSSIVFGGGSVFHLLGSTIRLEKR